MALRGDGLWPEGVYMQLGQPYEFRVVGSTRAALDILTDRWPVDPGLKHHSAVAVCRWALRGGVDTGEARKAFIEAVEESGTFITDRVPRNLVVNTPTNPYRKSTDMKFHPKKSATR